MKRLFILNASAKRARLLKNRIKRTLENMGIHGQFIEVRVKGEAKKIAEKALEKEVDQIIAIGGDGLVNDIIQIAAHQKIQVGVVPIGENNLVAHLLGINNWLTGCLAIKNNNSHDIDLGLYNDRYFIASIEISSKQEKPNKTILSKLSKKVTLSYSPVEMKIKKESSMISFQGEVANIDISPLPFNKKSQIDDFLSDQMLHIKIKSKPEKTGGQPIISTLQGDFIDINSKNPLNIFADGEKSGKTPVSIRVAPKAVKFIIPQDKNAKETGYIAENQ